MSSADDINEAFKKPPQSNEIHMQQDDTGQPSQQNDMEGSDDTKPPPSPMNAWAQNKTSASIPDVNSSSNISNINKKALSPHKSLAEIMKEQELESQLQLNERSPSKKPDIRSVTFGGAHVMESEEDRMLRLAIEASLQDVDPSNDVPAAASTLETSTMNSVAVARSTAILKEEEDIDDDMKLAIQLSMQDVSLVKTDAFTTGFSDDDDCVPPLIPHPFQNCIEDEEDRKISASSIPTGALSENIDDSIQSSSPLKSTGLDDYEEDPTMTTVAATGVVFPILSPTSAASTVSSSVSATSTASLGASTASTASESTSTTAAAVIPSTAAMSSGFLSVEEEEQIARAIRDAEDAEAASSLKLAMELQKQENQIYQCVHEEQARARNQSA